MSTFQLFFNHIIHNELIGLFKPFARLYLIRIKNQVRKQFNYKTPISHTSMYIE